MSLITTGNLLLIIMFRVCIGEYVVMKPAIDGFEVNVDMQPSADSIIPASVLVNSGWNPIQFIDIHIPG